MKREDITTQKWKEKEQKAEKGKKAKERRRKEDGRGGKISL